MVAVTGATGFVGSHLVEALGAVAVPVSRRAVPGGRVADLADPAALAQAFRGTDAVIANAALSPGWAAADEAAFRAANVEGTENTLRAAAAAGVRRVVLVSTVAVYRTRLGVPLAEDAAQIDPDGLHLDWSRVTTRSGYARTKALAERRAWALAGELGLALTVVRPGPIVGPRDPKLTARLVRWAEGRFRPVPTVRLPLVHVGDVALAVVAALGVRVAEGRAYNLAGPPVALCQVVRALGGRPWPLPVPVTIAYDCRAAERDLGFRPRDVAEAVRSEHPVRL